jgi:hypothetical protein
VDSERPLGQLHEAIEHSASWSTQSGNEAILPKWWFRSLVKPHGHDGGRTQSKRGLKRLARASTGRTGESDRESDLVARRTRSRLTGVIRARPHEGLRPG